MTVDQIADPWAGTRLGNAGNAVHHHKSSSLKTSPIIKNLISPKPKLRISQPLHTRFNMKFSQEMAQQVAKLPPSWQGQVVPYKALKKSIHRIVNAMQETDITSLPADATAIYSVAGDMTRLDSQLVLYVNDSAFVDKLERRTDLTVREYDGTPVGAMQALHLTTDSPMLTAQDRATWNEAAFLSRLEVEREKKKPSSFSKVAVQLKIERELLPLPQTLIPPRSSSLGSLGNSLLLSDMNTLHSNSDADAGVKAARPADLMFSMEDSPDSPANQFAPYDYQLAEYNSSGDETDEEKSGKDALYSTSAPAAPSIALQDWDSDDSTDVLHTPKMSATNGLVPTSAGRQRSHSVNSPASPMRPINSPSFMDGTDSPTMTASVMVVSSGKLYSPKPSGKTFAMPLQADAEFLNQVAASLMQLSRFQSLVAVGIKARIDELKRTLAVVAGPTKLDMYAWRELLAAYLDAEIWETFGKVRKTAAQSEEQLRLFDQHVDTLRKKFRLMQSQKLVDEFLALSHLLCQLTLWSEVNERAIYKILKKHDKRTQLAASVAFAKMFSQEPFFALDLPRQVIQIVETQFLAIVPQSSDYECVLCMEIAYKPIKLKCNHRFCLACLLKAQRARKYDCPLCREPNAVKDASADHLDREMSQMLKTYFPKEVKAKKDERNEALLRAEQERLYQSMTRQQCTIS